MLDNAVRVCAAKFGGVYRAEGDMLRLIATHNLPLAYPEVSRREPFRPSPESFLGHIVASKSIAHFDDLTKSSFVQRREATTTASVELGNVRTPPSSTD